MMERLLSQAAAQQVGRPPLSRNRALEALWAMPRRGRSLVMVNERKLSQDLRWSRATVGRALNELEADGQVRRRRNCGRAGLLVQLLGERPAPAPPNSV